MARTTSATTALTGEGTYQTRERCAREIAVSRTKSLVGPMAMRDLPTLESMLAEAGKRLGSHKATMKALGVSRQRLYSATHGGPPLRVARVLKLGLIANAAPIDALRAGHHHEVAALLEEALTPSDSEITPADRAFVRAVARLPPDLRSSLQRHIDLLLAAIEQAAASDGRAHTSS